MVRNALTGCILAFALAACDAPEQAQDETGMPEFDPTSETDTGQMTDDLELEQSGSGEVTRSSDDRADGREDSEPTPEPDPDD